MFDDDGTQCCQTHHSKTVVVLEVEVWLRFGDCEDNFIYIYFHAFYAFLFDCTCSVDPTGDILTKFDNVM